MAAATASPTVQHVTKASSDRLLTKFAESDPPSPPPPSSSSSSLRKLQMVRKRSRRVASGLGARDVAATECAPPPFPPSTRRRRRTSGAAEWKTLLPPSSRGPLAAPVSSVRTREGAGVGFLLAAMEKTWRKTIKGASKMFIEKHCNNHVRLISEVV